MTKTILELDEGECRFPVTGGSPFFFCGEITADETTSYCAVHHRRCHSGFGKDPRMLEEMMYGIEQTVVRKRPSDESPNTRAVDVVVRGER